FNQLNTGLLYRAVAYLRGRDASSQLSDIIAGLRYTFDDHKPLIYWREELLSQELLYTPSIDQGASLLSADPAVRQALLPVQRALAAGHNVIADGRDCGSVVFPSADVKIFLTASVLVRAQRLMHAADRQYEGMTLEAIMEQVRVRDERDKTRAIAPLIVPPTAVVIDSSDLNFEQTVAACAALIKRANLATSSLVG
ncbi:cytidylate kinase, partial [bacterium]|nr:cytidylate kinase [bacterium]